MVYVTNIKEPEPENLLQLTARFTRAVDYARQVHVGCGKGTKVPYMAHLLRVASLVMGESGRLPFPVTEDMVIAALLHDAVEDEGDMPRLRDIEEMFGKEVAKIVEGCSDSFAEDSSEKLDWEVRKRSYIGRLWEEPEGTLLVSVADKVYSSRATLEDYRYIGPKVWDLFQRGREKRIWYYGELIKIYEQRCPDWRLVDELKRVFAELEELSKGDPEVHLDS